MLVKYQEMIGPMPKEMANCLSRAMVQDVSFNRWRLLGAGPSEEMRKAMLGRRESIRRCVAAANPADAAECIAGLLMMYPARGSELEAAKIVAGYVKALEGLPIWAIFGACNGFSSGKLRASGKGGSSSFRPSAEQVAEEARRLVRPLKEESLKLYQLLKAEVDKPISEGERAVVSAKFKALIAELKTKKEADPENAEFKKWSEQKHSMYMKARFEARGMDYDPLKLSPEVFDALGLPLPAKRLQEADNSSENPQ